MAGTELHDTAFALKELLERNMRQRTNQYVSKYIIND